MEKNTYREKEERSVAGLLSELTQEMSSLLRHEVALAKTEISEKTHQAVTGGVSLAVGGVVAFAGFLVLLASAVYGLAQVMEIWLAALVVGVLVLIVGLIMLQKGRSNLKAKNLAPHRTMNSMRQDKSFARQHMRST